MAATVTGSVVALSGGGASAATLKFDYLSAPSISQGSLVKSNSIVVNCDTNGLFSVPNLVGGQYRVTIGNNTADQWLIEVPDTSSSYDIASLRSPQLSGYDRSSTRIPNASANIPGIITLNSILTTGSAAPTGTPASLLYWDSTHQTLWINSSNSWLQLLAL